MPRVRRPLLALIALVLALAVGYAVKAAQTDDPAPKHARQSAAQPSVPASPATALSSLPKQVAQTLTLIERHGPFPYPRNDGAVFHNNEHALPSEPGGYYREYTVPTPGSADRGARRIITGRNGEIYYTADHYASFVRVDTAT